jgi:hypothetical protein
LLIIFAAAARYAVNFGLADDSAGKILHPIASGIPADLAAIRALGNAELGAQFTIQFGCFLSSGALGAALAARKSLRPCGPSSDFITCEYPKCNKIQVPQIRLVRHAEVNMTSSNRRFAFLLLAIVMYSSGAAATFPDSAVPLPVGWSGPVFHLSQNYPQQIPTDSYPWLQFDPTSQPDQYMLAVLQYCLEGNVQTDWMVQANTKRGWYHAPWMHWGAHGREPIHGLTFERMSLPGELAPQQSRTLQNWAVGMYNAPGGFTIGQVWANPLKPNTTSSQFPPNTVSIKLLFTDGSPQEVPYLSGSKTWPAYVYVNPQDTGPGAPRVVKKLYLLQVDIAVRDPRANGVTGWVFGTFVYDGRNQGNDPYSKLRPVGMMWGNDPGLGPTQYQQGARATQSKLYLPTQPIMRHYGWLGRLNGPVDNPKSSCLSCHSTA